MYSMLLYMLFSVEYHAPIIIFLMDLLYVFDANVTVYTGISGHPSELCFRFSCLLMVLFVRSNFVTHLSEAFNDDLALIES